MLDHRKTPEDFLVELKNEKIVRGKLKIFFGFAPGVGKTYAMLKAAHEALEQDIDVVVGYIEPHSRPQTMSLLKGLEQLPTLNIDHKGITLREFDLDGALRRYPQLILVDELAHTNADDCRHIKRYQDIDELLRMGIDVFTTVNVQHIESLNDIVSSFTGVVVKERIPDRIFDGANQVELVDIEPTELVKRLNEGKVYGEQQAKNALKNFFTIENLTALREIALRRTADHVNLNIKRVKPAAAGDYHTEEHILVCISSSPTNAKIIRTAARMAAAFKGRFTALFVETSAFSEISAENRARLSQNVHLAEQFGAKIETVFGDDIPFQITEFARLTGVSDIVVGRSNDKRRSMFPRPTFTEQLTALAPNLDIHVIPDKITKPYKVQKTTKKSIVFDPADILKTLASLVLTTLVGFLFQYANFSVTNIITIYILGTLVTAVITSNRIYSLITSVLSVLVFNFFFTEPRYSLLAYDPGYPVTFVIMFIAALISGNLATKIKLQAKQSVLAASRTRTLLETNQLLERAKDKDDILKITATQLVLLLNRSIVVYAADERGLLEPMTFTCPYKAASNVDFTSEKERAVAAWTFKNKKHAGASTDTLCAAKCYYLAIRSANGVYGVVGIQLGANNLEPFETSLVLSILGECALALEKELYIQRERTAAIQAQKEQLRANLLRTISHDLRTPLTGISGNAHVLLQNNLPPEKCMQLYADIYDEAQWLIKLVENLLSVTRIEDGTMQLNMAPELVDEVIAEALKHLSRKSAEHTITFLRGDELLLASMDTRLIIQVVINIIDNAIKYTPNGSIIEISAVNKDGMVEVSVADNGPGIEKEAKEKLFDMFYTANATVSDSHRGLGLGLSLCKSIITAHGGTITVTDNQPSGSIFRFTLPAKEVTINE